MHDFEAAILDMSLSLAVLPETCGASIYSVCCRLTIVCPSGARANVVAHIVVQGIARPAVIRRFRNL